MSRIFSITQLAFVGAMFCLFSVPASAFQTRQLENDVTFPEPFGYVGGQRDIDDYDWPDELPPFRLKRALIAPDGNLWVERYVSAGSAPIIDVFDSLGRKNGEFRLSAGRRVAGFGDGVGYLVYTDEVGLQWVERYRLLVGG